MFSEQRNKEKYLSIHKARQLLYWSFEYSQGNPELQKNLLRYYFFLNPNTTLTNETFDKLKEEAKNPKSILFQMVLKKIEKSGHKKFADNILGNSLKNEIDALYDTAVEVHEGKVEETTCIISIFVDLLRRDSYFKRNSQTSKLIKFLDPMTYTHPFFRKTFSELRDKIKKGEITIQDIENLDDDHAMKAINTIFRNSASVPAYLKVFIEG